MKATANSGLSAPSRHAAGGPAGAGTGAAPGGEKAPGGDRRHGRRTKLRGTQLAAILVVALLASLSAKLFVWPAHDPLYGEHADAILVMNGAGPRLEVAEQLAREGAAPVVLVSTASVRWDCPYIYAPGVDVQCFRPSPFDTRGEARYAAAQARAHGWHSLIVVSSVAQSTRARLRVERCFPGHVRMVVATPSVWKWAYEVVYEWGALAKAEIWQRGC